MKIVLSQEDFLMEKILLKDMRLFRFIPTRS
nr:MAG TPA: hypothetical protein [Caudoviricetes sp.]